MERIEEMLKILPKIEEVFDDKTKSEILRSNYSELGEFSSTHCKLIKERFLCESSELLAAFEKHGINDKDKIAVLILQMFHIFENTSRQ